MKNKVFRQFLHIGTYIYAYTYVHCQWFLVSIRTHIDLHESPAYI